MTGDKTKQKQFRWRKMKSTSLKTMLFTYYPMWMEIWQLLLVVSAVVVKLFRQNNLLLCWHRLVIVNNIKGHVSHMQRKRPVSVCGMQTVRCEVNNSAADGTVTPTQLGSYWRAPFGGAFDLDLCRCQQSRGVWFRMSSYLCDEMSPRFVIRVELVQCTTGLLIAKVLFRGCWKGPNQAYLSSVYRSLFSKARM